MSKGAKKVKKVKIAASTQAPKTVPPPSLAPPGWLNSPTVENRYVSWHFCCADPDGKWAWANIAEHELKKVVSKLADFERMDSHTELQRARHELEIGTLCKEAQDRLRELKRDDVETLVSWHCGGPPRLWCAEYEGMMCVLWWDPRHEVYPVEKKHTH